MGCFRFSIFKTSVIHVDFHVLYLEPNEVEKQNDSSFLVAMGDISLRKTGVDEKRAKVHKESKTLLEYTRKAIARLTYLKR